jgi:hypothetical protein
MSTISPGARIGAWEVLNVDASGRQASCACVCKAVRIVSVAALLDGSSTSCGCRQLSQNQRAALRTEAEAQKRARELKDWRPG